MKFYKYQGAGNDFILIEKEDANPLAFPEPDAIATLCHRKFGIGADGVVFIVSSKVADCKMHYYNADGTAAAFCGNATRCVAHFLRHIRHMQRALVTIETENSIAEAQFINDRICVNFGRPVVLLKDPRFFVVDTGVPHAVVWVDKIEELDVEREGKEIRYAKEFQPAGVNVTFAQLLEKNVLKTRTYERGVEGETLSCATGMAAAAFAAKESGMAESNIQVWPRSNVLIEVIVEKEILVSGPANCVFVGEIME